MPSRIDVYSFFEAVVQQNPEKLRAFFAPDATIVWPNTNEEFSTDEYVRVNCDYPGKWQGRVEECFHHNNRIILVARVWNVNNTASRVVSFIEFDTENGIIHRLTEYWGDIGEPPEWRQKMCIG